MRDKADHQTPSEEASGSWMRRLPLIFILIVAAVGAFTLRDTLTFDMLRDNREALLAFRDANYGATVALFMLAYVLIVAFSLPGATIATLTGGFLFATFPAGLVLYWTWNNVLSIAQQWLIMRRVTAKMKS